MEKYPEEPTNVRGRNDNTVEFIRSKPAEAWAIRRGRHANSDFKDLQQRAQWLAEVGNTLNQRGRQSTRKSLSSAHLDAYRSSVMERQGDRITIHDVKQVAVGLLQENYLLPIPFNFLAIVKSQEFDDILAALLLYFHCFFEHKSLENNPNLSEDVDVATEHRILAEAFARKEIAQKKLAVCYFSLIMDLEIEQQASYRKGRMSSKQTEWLLHACLYSFFCFEAWVTFGRKDLRDIQEEVGRLLYSDTFNAAVRTSTESDSGTTSEATAEADPKESGSNGTFRHRTRQQRPSLSRVVNQRSPLMASLLPSPKERSPHLFPGGRATRQTPERAVLCDTRALTEELNQQLASVRFGILGEPLEQLGSSSLMPGGEERLHRDDDACDTASHANDAGEDHQSVRAGGSSSPSEGSTGATGNTTDNREAVTSEAQ